MVLNIRVEEERALTCKSLLFWDLVCLRERRFRECRLHRLARLGDRQSPELTREWV